MVEKRKFSSYKIHFILYIFLIIMTFILEDIDTIFYGLRNIIISPALLVTDYFHIGGIGATLVNVSLLGLLSIGILKINNVKESGKTFIALWMMTGFAMFGKNILNIWPLIMGVWMYSKYKRKSFSNYAITAILATTLAPTVSIFYLIPRHEVISMILAIIVGGGVGFIVPIVAEYTSKITMGFNLYNFGLAGGIIGLLIMSCLKSFGYEPVGETIWYTGSDIQLVIIIIGISLYLLGVGLISRWSTHREELILLNKESGKDGEDFFIKYGETCYVNMGILGIGSTIFVFVIKGNLNGPTMGAIFTMIGFSCAGKHIRNIIPVISGAVVAAFLTIQDHNSPAMIVTIIFSSALAPISGYFGWIYGVIAGGLHVILASNIAGINGGINLYNNGFASGLVTIILVPIIICVKKDRVIAEEI